jgi:hypothetical protein
MNKLAACVCGNVQYAVMRLQTEGSGYSDAEVLRRESASFQIFEKRRGRTVACAGLTPPDGILAEQQGSSPPAAQRRVVDGEGGSTCCQYSMPG